MRRSIGAVLTVCFFAAPAVADDFDGVRQALEAGDRSSVYGQLAQMGDAGDTLAALMMADFQLVDSGFAAELGLAEAWLQHAAEQGSIEAMLQLGALYQRSGQVFTGDLANPAAGFGDAIHWYGMAVDTGSPEALTRLGNLYFSGLHSAMNAAITPEEERALARTNLESAVAAGRVDAMVTLGLLVRSEDGDDSAHAAFVRDAALMGDPEALGWILSNPDAFGVNEAVGVAAWALAAQTALRREPNPRSPILWVLGLETLDEFDATVDGLVAPLNDAQRSEAIALAAAITSDWPNLMPGNSDASAAAGDFDAVRTALDAADFDAATGILAAMGDGGDTLAMVVLADLYLVHSDKPRIGLAVAWLEQAAEAGNVGAMLQLGVLYQDTGLNLFPDRQDMAMAAGFPEAVAWYERAIDAGSAHAQFRLGMLFRLGMYARQWEALTPEAEQELARDLLSQAYDAGLVGAYSGLGMMVRRDDKDLFAAMTLEAALAGEPTAVGILAGRPEMVDISDPVETVAWALAGKINWELSRHPRSPVFIVPGASTADEFYAAMDDVIAEATPEVLAAAQARAEEISAAWISYLPGRYEAEDDQAATAADEPVDAADQAEQPAAEESGSLFGGGQEAQPAETGYDTVRAALDAGDYDTAYATLAAMGNAGDTLAMTMLANLQLGYATSGPNFGLALAWLEEAADAGSVHAMIQLGWMHQFHAPGIDPAATQMGALYPEAADWYRQAINAGSAVAVARLGLLHRLRVLSMVDESVSPDDEDEWARSLLEQAAEAGSPEAMSALAMIVRRDDQERSGALMQQAAAIGDPTALGLLAIKPEDFGVTDATEALAWDLAAAARWEMDQDPRSRVWTALGVESELEFRAWLSEVRSAATPDMLAAAETRAAELSAGWTNLLPGHSAPVDGGGLFGRN